MLVNKLLKHSTHLLQLKLFWKKTCLQIEDENFNLNVSIILTLNTCTLHITKLNLV